MLITTYLSAQTHTEKITRELTFEKKSVDNALMIANINGSINVESYEGDKILVEVSRTIRAKTEERLAKGKKNLRLGTIDRADTIILYVDGLCSSFGRRKDRDGWGYQWEDCGRGCEEEYDYDMDFTVKIPSATHLMVSTINNGDIVIANAKGSVIANNINGSVKLTNLVREADVHTINGNVDIEYARNPQNDCRFYTLNGDINAWFQKGLAASLSFESFNGDFYTNIDKLEPMPVEVEKKSTGDGIRYKVNGNRFKVGSGGANLDFETFNGNVYLKEKD
jgi:DUF4097 and DUF4098 domain-containing protein YvlB